MKRTKPDLIRKCLLEALVEAEHHLEYCGYGDSYERECADDNGLAKKTRSAIEAAEASAIEAMDNEGGGQHD